MPDFSIDYSTLYNVQAQMKKLAEQAASGGATGAFKELGDANSGERTAALGTSGLSYEFNLFYHHSKSRTESAKEGLEKLSESFKAVSDIFFDADANISSAAGLMGNSVGLSDWKSDKAAYDNWVADKAEWDAYLESIGATEWFAEHPDETSIRAVCHADDAPPWCANWNEDKPFPMHPGDAPEKPGPPPTSYHYEDENGTIDVKIELDKDDNVVKETSTITNPEGQTFTTETVYNGPPQMIDPPGDAEPYDVRDYTITTTSADGTKSTATVTINEDGSGTMVTVDGEEKVTSTRSGPDAEWVETGREDL